MTSSLRHIPAPLPGRPTDGESDDLRDFYVSPRHPALSVVLLSAGRLRELHGAMALLVDRCRALGAELLVVRPSDALELDALSAAYPEASFLATDVGMPVAEMRTCGMQAASGDIVLLRNEGDVGDGRWLSPFASHAAVGAGARPAERVAVRPVAVLGDVDDAMVARATPPSAPRSSTDGAHETTPVR